MIHRALPSFSSSGSSAQPLNPVAVVTLLLYTMAGWLHNVFLPWCSLWPTLRLSGQGALQTVLPHFPPCYRKAWTHRGVLRTTPASDSRMTRSLEVLPWGKCPFDSSWQNRTRQTDSFFLSEWFGGLIAILESFAKFIWKCIVVEQPESQCHLGCHIE